MMTPRCLRVGRALGSCHAKAQRQENQYMTEQNRSLYEGTGQLQLLHRSYHWGLPTRNMGEVGLDSELSLNYDAQGKSCVSTNVAKPQYPLFKQLIGDTPLVDLSSLSANPAVTILGKCEFANPSLSIKDRIAQYILTQAELDGLIKPGDTIVAATSGNTGAAVAMISAMKGYNYIVVTNEKCSDEKIDGMRAFGGQVLVQPCVPADHPEHYQNKAHTICAENKGFFDVNQYDNPNNPKAYYHTLGPEIWRQTHGTVTHFVAGKTSRHEYNHQY
eukprot:TRINITY_DN4954_c0_g1_i2.p2 TRINITY_DN4954_c0_g1~~TRINITY_DN4954_c0_g1_i2.p2  ORF type:complete len:274 (-),score=23.76 TRINITY_DN4954_c0_g1_i2:852-1673(-)